MAYKSKYKGAEVDAALDKANTALQEEQYKGTVEAVETGAELDDTIEYATKAYVDNAIMGAINTSY